MSEQDVVSRLRSCASPDALRSLADEVSAESLNAPRALAGLWSGGERVEARKAGSVVTELEELAMGAMLAEFDSCPGNWRIRYMSMVVETQLGFRHRIMAELDGLLSDKAAVSTLALPDAAPPGSPPLRVCDEAYLLIHRMVRIDESMEPGLRQATAFVALAEPDRDKELQKWRKSGTWRAMREEDEEPQAARE